MRTAVIAALPREIATLTKHWERVDVTQRGVTAFRRGGDVAVTAGMGCDRVSRAVEVALLLSRAERLLSVGLAGACSPGLRAGDVLRPQAVVDVRSGERFETNQRGEVLATVPEIATVAEKKRLHESYGAAAVDMEAACVARLARAHGLAFGSIKAISDDAAKELSALARFATRDGGFREGAFALQTALRPWTWNAAVQLGRDSGRALRALQAAVHEDMEGTGN